MNRPAIKTAASIIPYYRHPNGTFVFQTQELLGRQVKIQATNIITARNKLEQQLKQKGL